MATTLRLGKTHYEALLPQLEEMGWTSADAHQALQATGARDLASAIDWLVARPASGEGGAVEPTPYQAQPPAVVVPVPASSSLSAPSAALAPVAPAGGAEKSEYERKQRELELRKAREEKRQREEEQRRIKEHIKDMKLDRARKYNRGGGETTGRASVPTTTGSAPSTPTPAASASAASSSPVALLQIRLPTGATVKHEFASTDTLGAVYEFVSQSTGRDVANFLLLQPGIPKVEYPIETALTTTLAQAELVPRGSITVMNREDKGVVRGAEAEPAMHFRRVRYGHAGSDDDDDEGELNADAVDTDAMSYEQLLALEERIGEVGKGLSKQVLATLPIFAYDSSVSILGDPMCAFCLSDYDTGNILRKLPCGHAFHKARVRGRVAEEQEDVPHVQATHRRALMPPGLGLAPFLCLARHEKSFLFSFLIFLFLVQERKRERENYNKNNKKKMNEEEREREEARLREVFTLGFIDQPEFELRLRALRGEEAPPASTTQQPPLGQNNNKKNKKNNNAKNAVVGDAAAAAPIDDDGSTIKCRRHEWRVMRAGVAHGANGVISEVAPVASSAGVSRAYAKEVREATDEDQVAYLHKELTILTHKTILANPNIVHLYDWRPRVMVSTTDGVHDQTRVAVPPCLVMEVCDRSIKDLMRERHYPHFLPKEADRGTGEVRTELMSEADVVKIGLDVLNALSDLHGVLQTYHGDISNKNVMRSRRGGSARYVLIDFGSSSQFGTRITTPVSQVYAAPEKLDGDWARCDGRCDVFALAVLLSELLVGRPHRDRADIEWLPTHHPQQPQRPQQLRTWADLLVSDLVDWRAFFDGALVADAARRWDAAQAAAALRRRPSVRQKRERARDKRLQAEQLRVLTDASPEPLGHHYSLPSP